MYCCADYKHTYTQLNLLVWAITGELLDMGRHYDTIKNKGYLLYTMIHSFIGSILYCWFRQWNIMGLGMIDSYIVKEDQLMGTTLG
mmetsp:Transcript_35156/g.85154  ORF Transcript_35156/g.85154 Transcript_35156/m.85154 type:complete len:86 (+) Transcript_35156:1447-1704(+)